MVKKVRGASKAKATAKKSKPPAKSVAKAKGKPVAKAKGKPVAKAKGKPVAKAKGKPVAKAKAKPVAKAKAKPTSKSAPSKGAPAKSRASKSAPAKSAPVTKASPSAPKGMASAKAAGNAGATAAEGDGWRVDLRTELARLPDDFAAYCADSGTRASSAWAYADDVALKGLEAWGLEVAARDRRMAVAALVAFAQAGFPLAMAKAGGAEENMGFHSSEPSMDGAPVETQIAFGAAWLADASDANRAAVANGFDPTRQLHVWEDDLRPTDNAHGWYWFYEVGQCIAHAITGDDGSADAESYYGWTPAQSVARGLVMVARAVRDGDSVAAIGVLRAGAA